MPTTENALHKRAAGALAVLTLASVGLSACGGSSSGTTSHANAAATGASGTTTSTTGAAKTLTGAASHPGAPATGRPRFPAIRACLRKNGVNLPSPTQGATTNGHNGVPTATLQAALKKCYAGSALRPFNRPNTPPAAARTATSPIFRQALAKYGECLRHNGVNLPAPNTSGKGPIFSTKGLNTSSPQFRAATMKCRATLIGAFRQARGAAG